MMAHLPSAPSPQPPRTFGQLTLKVKRLLRALVPAAERLSPTGKAQAPPPSPAKGSKTQPPPDAAPAEHFETTLPLWPDPWIPLALEAQHAERRTEARLLIRTARTLERQGQFDLARAIYLQAQALLSGLEGAEEMAQEITGALQRLRSRPRRAIRFPDLAIPFLGQSPWLLGAEIALLVALLLIWWMISH